MIELHHAMAHSEETKRRISEAMKGKTLGRKRPQDAVEKCRKSLRKAHADGRCNGFKKGNNAGDWTGKKHAPATKVKMREARLKNQPMHRREVAEKVSRTRIEKGIGRGASNSNWKGGTTSESLLVRRSTGYLKWREAVFIRDGYTCQHCGDRCGNGKNVVLNAHHIKSFAHHPQLRLEVSNGLTLCKPCHDAIPKGNQHHAHN